MIGLFSWGNIAIRVFVSLGLIRYPSGELGNFLSIEKRYVCWQLGDCVELCLGISENGILN